MVLLPHSEQERLTPSSFGSVDQVSVKSSQTLLGHGETTLLRRAMGRERFCTEQLDTNECS